LKGFNTADCCVPLMQGYNGTIT